VGPLIVQRTARNVLDRTARPYHLLSVRARANHSTSLALRLPSSRSGTAVHSALSIPLCSTSCSRVSEGGVPHIREYGCAMDVRWMCDGCAVDVRWICARTCADIAMSVRVDIARISYGYADIARISHGCSKTQACFGGDNPRTPSYYSYVCHYPLSESQAPKPVPPSLACAQPSVMH